MPGHIVRIPLYFKRNKWTLASVGARGGISVQRGCLGGVRGAGEVVDFRGKINFEKEKIYF
jgi:hypothetical protein